MFAKLGWPKPYITCIDIAEPNPPIVRDVTWLYVNVNAFGQTLLSSRTKDVPQELSRLKHHFNIIIASYAQADAHNVAPVAGYFLARRGKLITM